MENFEPQLRKDFLITYSPNEEGFRVKQNRRIILKSIPTLEKAIAAADELAAGKETAAIANKLQIQAVGEVRCEPEQTRVRRVRPEFFAHELEKNSNGWYCSVCQQSWRRKPRSSCPKLTYYNSVPEGLYSEYDLLEKGYRKGPEQKPCGFTDPRQTLLYYLDGAIPLKHAYRGLRISKAGLKGLGWTEGAIKKFLGEPDDRVENPHYSNAAPMCLYYIARIEEAEDTPEFQKWLKKRNAKLGRPMPDDAVLGGDPTPPGALVLGGLEGVRYRLASSSESVRAGARKEAMRYGAAGRALVEEIAARE